MTVACRVSRSFDRRRIVSGSTDKTLRLWDAATGAPIGDPLRGHEEAVTSVVFSRDGRRIVSGSRDTTLRLWDAETGAPIGELMRGHDGGVRTVVFSPDGRRLVSGSDDRTLRFWEVAALRPSLADLAAKAETLCPLSASERRELHLFDPTTETNDRPLTEAQRRACGEPAVAAK